jgi:hypothetical protein
MTATVVFGYPDGRLANPVFRSYKRARRASRTRGLDVQVELRPFGDLPSIVDVLVVDGPVDRDALGSSEVRRTIVTTPDRAPAELEACLDQLVESGELGHAPPPPRTIAVHRGVEPVAGRARILDAS